MLSYLLENGCILALSCAQEAPAAYHDSPYRSMLSLSPHRRHSTIATTTRTESWCNDRLDYTRALVVQYAPSWPALTAAQERHSLRARCRNRACPIGYGLKLIKSPSWTQGQHCTPSAYVSSLLEDRRSEGVLAGAQAGAQAAAQAAAQAVESSAGRCYQAGAGAAGSC
eukprot:SAG31_NODE_1510_length_8062_cov_4.204194_4_plen_169_part_00